MSEIPWVHIISYQKGFWPNFFLSLGCLIVVPIFLLLLPLWWLVRKLLGLPLHSTIERSAAEVADILRNFVDGDEFDVLEWDEFICVSIADPALESIRIRASDTEILGSDERTAILRVLLAESEALAVAGVLNVQLPHSSVQP